MRNMYLPEFQTKKKTSTTRHLHSPPELQTKKQSINILLRPSCWIFISLMLIQILAFFVSRTSTRRSAAAAAASRSENCPAGKVYAYDLPSIFNDDLLQHNCTDLDRWVMDCGIVPNDGFGSPAAELRRLLPENLSRSWFRTNQFALELIFHRRLLQHKCRTLEPESAAAFYIPFYAGLAVGKYLWSNNTADRDRHCEMLVAWIQRQSHWKKSKGSDHFTTIGRITWDFRRLADPNSHWGSKFLNMPEMGRVTRLIIEKAVWDHQDVAVPYPTGFHPDTGETVKNWQDLARRYNRSSLFAFVGAARPSAANDFRGILMSYCADVPELCRLVDCAAGRCVVDSSVVLESFLGSEFCLQPPGDSPTRRSAFDCMVAGSVPVFFSKASAYDQYGWFLPVEPESYSVFIDEKDVMNRRSVIEEVLTGYSKEEIRRKREKVIETIPRIIYGGGTPDFEDAFEIALNGVLERIRKEKLRLWW